MQCHSLTTAYDQNCRAQNCAAHYDLESQSARPAVRCLLPATNVQPSCWSLTPVAARAGPTWSSARASCCSRSRTPSGRWPWTGTTASSGPPPPPALCVAGTCRPRSTWGPTGICRRGDPRPPGHRQRAQATAARSPPPPRPSCAPGSPSVQVLAVLLHISSPSEARMRGLVLAFGLAFITQCRWCLVHGDQVAESLQPKWVGVCCMRQDDRFCPVPSTYDCTHTTVMKLAYKLPAFLGSCHPLAVVHCGSLILGSQQCCSARTDRT